MKKLTVRSMTYIGLMTALLCIVGPLSVPIGIVPVSLTSFAVLLVALILGGYYGTICCAVYLLIGMVGVPVFSAFSGGVGKLFGPTGGYLIAFLFVPMIVAYFSNLGKKNIYQSIIGMVVASIVIYLFGSAWLAFQMEMTYGAAFAVGVIPFVGFDALKIVAAFVIAIPVNKALEKANLGI